MPDRFYYRVVEIDSDGEKKVKLEFSAGKHGMISVTLRELLDILRQKFPNEVFEKIKLCIYVADSTETSEPEVCCLITNQTTPLS